MQPELIADYECETGEGPTWHPLEKRVYWIDIPNGRMFRYDPAVLRHGWNEVAGERVFFISNPGLGLWALRSQFASEPNGSTEGDHAE